MAHIKYVMAIAAVLCIFFLGQGHVHAEQSHETKKNDMVDDVSLEEVQEYWNKAVGDYGEYISGLQKTSLRDFIKGDESFSVKQTLIGLLEYLLHELILNGKLLGSLLLLTIFSAILQTMHTAFEKNAVSKVAYFVVFLVLIFLALNSFFLSVSYAKDAIDMMSSFMIALLPLVLGLMATFGNIASVSFFHPIVIFLINFSGILVSRFILPLLFTSVLLSIVSTINESYKATHLANLLKNVALGALGGFLTIFLSILSLQGASSAIQDGVAMKTAKFVTGNFIPVVGRTFTDAADTMLSASLLLKNSIGIVGVVVIVLFSLFPAVKIFAIGFIYKLAAAVLQPIGDGPVITSLDTISKYIMYILACLLTVTLMFFLAIVIIVVSSNITLLLR